MLKSTMNLNIGRNARLFSEYLYVDWRLLQLFWTQLLKRCECKQLHHGAPRTKTTFCCLYLHSVAKYTYCKKINMISTNYFVVGVTETGGLLIMTNNGS